MVEQTATVAFRAFLVYSCLLHVGLFKTAPLFDKISLLSPPVSKTFLSETMVSAHEPTKPAWQCSSEKAPLCNSSRVPFVALWSLASEPGTFPSTSLQCISKNCLFVCFPGGFQGLQSNTKSFFFCFNFSFMSGRKEFVTTSVPN